MISHRVLACVVALSLLQCLSACRSGPPPVRDPLPGEKLASLPGQQYLSEAREAWDAVNARDTLGPARAAAIRSIMERLDAAQTLDPSSPLPMTLKAYMHMEADQYPEAEALFRQSLGPATGSSAGSQDWAPGYIGLARIAFAR
ncbi:MAG: hypothetical protein ACOYN0_13130, partial [Phycisphaerales bacterium]